jgi:hypothetical protein
MEREIPPRHREQVMKAASLVDEVRQVCDPRASDHPPHALSPSSSSRPNTGVKLRSSIMLGFVSFNSLLGGVAHPSTDQAFTL